MSNGVSTQNNSYNGHNLEKNYNSSPSSPHSANENNSNGTTKRHKSKSKSLDGSQNSGFLLQSIRRPRSNSGKLKGKTVTQPVIGPLTPNTPNSSNHSANSNGSGYSSPSSTNRKNATTATTTTSPANDESDQFERTKEAARLASMIMNMKTAEAKNDGSSYAKFNAQPPPVQEREFSQGTLFRARKAKAKLELKYQMIQNFQQDAFPDLNNNDGHDDENEDDKTDGPDDNNFGHSSGYFNPLQTIRNRIYRPAASGNSKPDYIWKVTPQELVQDFSWQLRNRHKMRDRRGRLIFNKDGERQQLKSPFFHHQPHHYHNNNNNNNHHSHHSSVKSYGDELTQRIKTKLGQSKDKDNGSSDNSSEGGGDVLSNKSYNYNNNNSPDRSLSEGGYPKQQRQSNEFSNSPLKEISIESVQRKSDPAPQSPPLTTTPPYELSNNSISKSKVSIASSPPVKIPESSSSPPPSEISPATATKALIKQPNINNNNSNNQPADSICKTVRELKYLEMVFFLSKLHLSRKNISSRTKQDDCHQSDSISQHITELSKNATNNLAPLAEEQLKAHENQASIMQKDLNNAKAPRMDSILVKSDNLISKVSTTLNLEVQKVGERMDRLEGDTPSPVKFFTKVGYAILEKTMVVIMWGVWLVVSAVTTVRGVIRLIIAIIRWLLFL